MDWLTDTLLAFVSEADNPAGLAVLGGSAMVEYIFPPFPGDTITLFGAVLITAYGWSFAGVFGAVMLGSSAGAMADYYLGYRLRLRRLARGEQAKQHRTIEELIAKFQRHGALYLVINRFLPGIRALFFVAAGMAGMKPLAVLAYGLVSAALWNLAIIAIGSALGLEFDSLLAWVRRYNLVVWCIVGAVFLVFVVREIRRRRAGTRESEQD